MTHETVAHATRTAAAGAPTGLRAAVHDDRSVDLSWDAVAGAVEYRIFELLRDPADTFKAAVTGTSSRRGPLKGGAYRYGVTARTAAGESAMSTLVDVRVPRDGGQEEPAAPPDTPHTALAGGAPGQVLDLSRWYLTMPIADPTGEDRSGPWDVHQPKLRTFRHELFDVRDGAVEYVAPAKGVTTSSASGATRCELREMKGPGREDKADWRIDSGTHTLTCTLTCDPTTARKRPECIVGQIHDEDGTPPIYLSVEMRNQPGVLVAFLRGTSKRSVLTGLGPDTVFTYRIRVENGRCRLWVARGGVEALPSSPTATFDRADLGNPGKCYFKAGAYNKSKIDDGPAGRSVVRHFRLDLE
jgi:hypothetical protein